MDRGAELEVTRRAYAKKVVPVDSFAPPALVADAGEPSNKSRAKQFVTILL